LYYHARALISARRWEPFADEVGIWLDSWPCPKTELLLIGPSAGYTLPTGWLAKFERLTAIDLDPLAPYLFRRRHQLPMDYLRADMFWRDGKLSIDPMNEILRMNRNANVLFCNVLGQVLLEGKANEDEWLAYLRKLRLTLKGRSWASYHDVSSMTTQRPGPFDPPGTDITDHLTGGDWVEGLKVKKFQWHLSSHRVHNVHAVFQTI